MCITAVSGLHRQAASAVSRTFTTPWQKHRRALALASPAAPYGRGMHKLHVTVLALWLAGAAVLGTTAVARTTGLGSAARSTNDAAVVAQTKRLAVFAAKLRKELKAKPPALPPVPKPHPVAAAAPAAAPRIVYHQPPPVVVTVHKHHGDDGEGGEGGGGD
jgi:hypothetical protein